MILLYYYYLRFYNEICDITEFDFGLQNLRIIISITIKSLQSVSIECTKIHRIIQFIRIMYTHNGLPKLTYEYELHSESLLI